MFNFEELECVNNFEYDKLAELIVKNGVRMTFKPETIVYNFNDDADGLYYIQSGKIRGFYLNEDGDKENVVVFSDKILFGEDIFASPRKRVLGADTVTQSVVYYINRDTLLNLCMQDRAAMSQLLGLFVKKMVVFLNALNAAQQMTSRKKLAQYLLHMGTVSENYLDFSHEKIAELIGTSRGLVTRLLNDFEKEGLIRNGYRNISILRMEGLMDIINDR